MLLLILFFLLAVLMPGDSLRQRFIFSSLGLSALIVTVTEVLSLFNSLNNTCVTATWEVVVAVVLAACIYKHKKAPVTISWPQKASYKYIAIVFIFLAMIFAEGVLYPPNNWDSLTYHMPRVVHWIQNGNVYPYVTQSYRQIYQSPFTEYFIAHIFLMHGSDQFSFAVQFFFLVCALICVYDSCIKLGFSSEISWFGVIVLLTIPSVLLEGSTTMNDLAIGYFILTSCYFAWFSIASRSYTNLVGFGLSAALTVATKGTGYLMLFPIGIAWMFQYLRRNKITVERIPELFFLLAIFLFINGGFFIRNYRLSHSILGGANDGYFNEPQAIKPLVSNLFRNIALHAGIYPANNIVMLFCNKLFAVLGINPNDPRTSFGNSTFAIARWGHHEDNAASFIHFVLILASATILIVKKDKFRHLFLLILALFFCILFLKWQPWSTRFHIPLLMLSALPIAAALRYAGKKSQKLVIAVCLLYGFIIIVFNPIRPLYSKPPLTAAVSISTPWKEKYYANRFYSIDQNMNATYQSIDSILKGEQTVGMRLKEDIWEYPLSIDNKGRICRKLIYTNVQNYTAKLKEEKHGNILYFISDDSAENFLFKNKAYYKIASYRELSIYKQQ